MMLLTDRSRPLSLELCTFSSTRHVPLALGCLKSYVESLPSLQGRIRVHLSDLKPRDDRSTWFEDLVLRRPDIVGFSVYIWNVRETLETIRRLKDRLPEVFIVLGGPEVGPVAGEVLEKNPPVDAVVVGEGEVTFGHLLEILVEGGLCEAGIPGLAFRSGPRIVLGPSRPPVPRLDDFPSPYQTGNVPLGRPGEIPCLESHRGCGFACQFCFYHKSYGTTRYFSLERVERDLKSILQRSPGRLIYLMDPTFNEKRERAKEVCRMLKRLGTDRVFHAEIRAELLDEELVLLMKEANLLSLEVGLQSADASVLKEVQRGWKEDRFLNGIRLLHQHGFYFTLQLIFGLPGEGWDGFLDSLRFAVSLRPPELTLFVLQMLPGVVLTRRSKELGIDHLPDPPYYIRRTADLHEQEVLRGAFLCVSGNYIYNFLPDTAARVCHDGGFDFVELLLRFHDWYIGEEIPLPPLAGGMRLEMAHLFPFLDSIAVRAGRVRGLYSECARVEIGLRVKKGPLFAA